MDFQTARAQIEPVLTHSFFQRQRVVGSANHNRRSTTYMYTVYVNDQLRYRFSQQVVNVFWRNNRVMQFLARPLKRFRHYAMVRRANRDVVKHPVNDDVKYFIQECKTDLKPYWRRGEIRDLTYVLDPNNVHLYVHLLNSKLRIQARDYLGI